MIELTTSTLIARQTMPPARRGNQQRTNRPI